MNDKITDVQQETAIKIIGLSDRAELTLSSVQCILKEHDAKMEALLSR